MAPMQSKLRQVLGVVKDQTSISLAKVAGTVHADLDVVLVKATSHDEIPIDEKYLQEIMLIISDSPSAMFACISGLAKRLQKTRDWIVALKCLFLAHQLLRAGDDKFEDNMIMAARRGLPFLNITGFRDEAHSSSWDFSSFVRAYASFLAERLDFYADVGSAGDNWPPRRGGKPEMYLDRLPKLQTLLDRAVTCCPTGAARMNRLVQIALFPVVRESFQLYFEICNGIAVLLDCFFETEHAESLRGLEIYSRAAKQADELASFYDTCKGMGVCASHEYPEVQRIPREHLETMEDFVREQANISSRESGIRLALPAPDSRYDDESHRAPSNGHDVMERSHSREKRLSLPAPAVLPTPRAPMNMVELPAVQEALLPPPSEKFTTSSRRAEELDSDLLNLTKASVSVEEHDEKVALALFPPSSGTTMTNKWEVFAHVTEEDGSAVGSGKTGWELALVSSDPPANVATPAANHLAGNFDNLLLDSLYEQGDVRQKQAYFAASGSASSVALMSGKPASSFLALPGPSQIPISEDPFAASAAIPPPAYVQMAEMRHKQLHLLKEQQLWQHYQTYRMQGSYALTNPNYNSHNGHMSTGVIHPIPYQYMGGITSYGPNHSPY